MISDHDIRQKLSLIADGALSLNDFEDWFVKESRNMRRDSSSEAIELAESIHLLLSERNDRILDEQALKQEFLQLLNVRHFDVAIDTQPAPQPAYLTDRRIRTYGPEIFKRANRINYSTSTASPLIPVSLQP